MVENVQAPGSHLLNTSHQVSEMAHQRIGRQREHIGRNHLKDTAISKLAKKSSSIKSQLVR